MRYNDSAMSKPIETPDRRINLKVSPETLRRLKIRAAEESTTMQGLIARWIEENLAKP
jgi:predicted DNA binding CopG/RHH family protein